MEYPKTLGAAPADGHRGVEALPLCIAGLAGEPVVEVWASGPGRPHVAGQAVPQHQRQQPHHAIGIHVVMVRPTIAAQRTDTTTKSDGTAPC